MFIPLNNSGNIPGRVAIGREQSIRSKPPCGCITWITHLSLIRAHHGESAHMWAFAMKIWFQAQNFVLHFSNSSPFPSCHITNSFRSEGEFQKRVCYMVFSPALQSQQRGGGQEIPLGTSQPLGMPESWSALLF